MEIPLQDTPSGLLIARGFADADAAAVADCQQLLRVAKRLLHFFLRGFTAHAISPGKYSVLCELLAADAPMSPSLLAERLGVSRPTITGLLDGLCEQGFALRVFDERDRRRVKLSLAPAGADFMRAFLPEQFQTMSDLIGVLGPGDRRRLRKMLTTLEAHLR